MRVTFLGAAGEVTGSGVLIETSECRFLVDAGMFQGARDAPIKNRQGWQRDLGRLDFVLLTHAHLDHCGLLPRFASQKHTPTIYCTRPTADLVPVMLKDSAHIQERNHLHNGNQKHADRRRREDQPPLYTGEDVDRIKLQLCGVPFDVEIQPHPAARVTFRSAGHIVGAASLDMVLIDEGKKRRIVISGDIGESSSLLVRDRAIIERADVLIVESTYGDRDHRSMEDTEQELIDVLEEVLHERRGNVIVPAFALGRTQELLVLLYELAQAQRIQAPLVFVDSPLAKSASDITFDHLEALDERARAFVEAQRRRRLPFSLRYTESAEDSMFLNSIKSGAIIIAASGMCDAGRIRHHLRHNLGRRESAVLITGFQAAGTLGRRLVDGAKQVRIMGEDIRVRASVHTLGGLSAHAGQTSLLAWLGSIRKAPAHTFIVHGEPNAAHSLAEHIHQNFHWQPTIAEPLHPYTV